MLGTAIIIFREVLEEALIIGLILAVTRGIIGRLRWIGIGLGSGLAGAFVLALLADRIANLAEGMGQELLNAMILLLAVGMLTWHLLWMKRHAASISREIKAVGEALNEGDKEPFILAVIVGLAILREGSESVIFLYGLASAGTTINDLILGSSLGLLAGVASGAVLYLGIARIPTGRLFQVSGWMLLLLTAGLASQASSYLVQADLLPAFGYGIWDSSFLLSQKSLLGQVLHVLIGYVDNPMGIQVLVYLLTVLLLGSTMYYMDRQTQIVKAG